jgi:hypothetical protein
MHFRTPKASIKQTEITNKSSQLDKRRKIKTEAS